MSIQRERVEVEPKMGRLAETMKRYCIGESTTRKLANAAGAVVRFEGSTLYDFGKIDRYLESLAGGGTDADRN